MGRTSFDSAGGRVALDTEGNVLLYVPENTFHRKTNVTWSLRENDASGCPELDIVAQEDGCEVEMKLFSKYIQITYKHVHSQTGSVIVEGGEDFPQLRVPRQNLEAREPDGENRGPVEENGELERSNREPEVKGQLEVTEQAEVKYAIEVRNTPDVTDQPEPEPEVESIFHTFYTFSDAETLVIYTKHFSRFSPTFLCPEHQVEGALPFDSNLTAALFRSKKPKKILDEHHLNVKVVLQVHDGVPIGQENRYNNPWRIADPDQYQYIKTVPVKTPPSSAMLEIGSELSINTQVEVGGEEWTHNQEVATVQDYLENCIPCRECCWEILPEAAVFQFTWKPRSSCDAGADMRTEDVLPGACAESLPCDFSFNMEVGIKPSKKGMLNALLGREEYVTSIPVDVQLDSPVITLHESRDRQVATPGADTMVCSSSSGQPITAPLSMLQIDGGPNPPPGGININTSNNNQPGGSSVPIQPQDGSINLESPGSVDEGVVSDLSPEGERPSVPRAVSPPRVLSQPQLENPVQRNQQEILELTSLHIDDIAKKLSIGGDIRTLGIHLGLEASFIQSAFANNKNNDVSSVVDTILIKWRDKTKPADAYRELWNALIRAKLINLAHRVLQKEPTN